MSNRAIIDKELTQGVVPIGTPRAYQYDQALVESAVATVRQGLVELGDYTDAKKGEYLNYATNILNAIQSQYGYPFVANTVSAMTDVSKIYVYTGNETGYTAGNWYYNNGTAWVSGGVFNSTEASTKAEMSLFGVDDLLWDNTTPTTKTQSGVTWTVDNINKSVSVTGTATATSFINFYNTGSGDVGIPSWLVKGQEYYASLRTDSKVLLQIFYYINSEPTILSVRNYTRFTIPINADNDKFAIRLAITSDNLGSIDTVVRPFISEAPSLNEITERIDNYVMARKYVSVPQGTDFDTLTDTGFSYISVNYGYINSPLPDEKQGLLVVYNTGTAITQFVYGTVTSEQYVRRYYTGTETWSQWQSNFRDVLDKSEASLFDVKDLLWNNTTPATTHMQGGVLYTTDKEARTVTISSGGVPSSASSVLNFYYSTTTSPTWLEAGKTYIMHLNTDADVTFELFTKDDADTPPVLYKSIKNHAEFTVDASKILAIIRLFVASGVTIDTVVRPFISESLSLGELSKNRFNRQLKILCIGHSTVQDEFTYAPFIMDRVAPDLEVTMGLAYKSSTNISGSDGFNANFDNADYKIGIYSKYTPHASSWINTSNTKTIKDVLDDEEWDVVVITESAKPDNTTIPIADTTHYAVFGEFMDKIINYVKRPLKFGTCMHHFRHSTNDYQTVIEHENSYEEIITQYRENILDVFPVQFFIPGITAYMNARGTVLDQYGDSPYHHMLADYAHYQEGIGCLVGGYTTALVLLNVAGINDRSVLGDQIVIDEQWVLSHNIPGKNPYEAPYVTGMETENIDRNRLLAQKCSVMAIKKPFEISTIV